MKNFIKQITKYGAIIGVVMALTTMTISAASVFFPYQGGTGTGIAPSAGKILIGNSSSTYTPAFLTASTGITISTSSGAITITNTGITTTTGNWIGTVQGKTLGTISTFNSTDYLPSSTALSFSPWNRSGTSVILATTTDFVGIGTTTPATALSVVGDISGTGLLKLTNSAQPTPVAGSILIHSIVNNGIPRLESDSVYTVNGCDVINRDNCVIVNNADATITIGQAVYVDGSVGSLPTVKLAQANAIGTAPVLGLVASSSITGGTGNGYIMTKGVLSNVNTSSFTAGNILYLSPTVAGGLTITRPTYPNLVTRIGTVLLSNVSTGSIIVEVAPAVLGRETGTINSTFNIGGSNAVTTTTFPQSLVMGTNMSSTTSNGVVTLNATGGGIFTLAGISTSTINVIAGTNVSLATTTSGLVFTGRIFPIQWLGYYASSTTAWDDPFFFFNSTSTISKVILGVKDGSANVNILYNSSQTAASSTANKLWTNDIVLTATTTPICYAVATSTSCPNLITSSTTPGINGALRFTASAASSTALTATIFYSEN